MGRWLVSSSTTVAAEIIEEADENGKRFQFNVTDDRGQEGVIDNQRLLGKCFSNFIDMK